MQQVVHCLPQMVMAELHMSVQLVLSPPCAALPSSTRLNRVKSSIACPRQRPHAAGRNVCTHAAVVSPAPVQHATMTNSHPSGSNAGTSSAAARYATARHVVTQRQQAKQAQEGQRVQQEPLDFVKLTQQLNQLQLQHMSGGRLPLHSQQQRTAQTALLQQQKQKSSMDEAPEQPSPHQLMLQQLAEHRVRRQQQHSSQHSQFAKAIALYSMCAQSSSMVEWQEAAYGLQQLARQISSPLQAQQVWQVAAALQAQPLHKQCARVLGGTVVELIKVTLDNHDLSILQALIASKDILLFSFNKRHIDKLLLAAVAADVSLEELQALLDLVPAASLSNRSYFVLIKSFMARQQLTEAAHCFHQMEVAGLHLTPALEQLQQELRTMKGGQL